jgi:hypothetical protein
MAPGWNFREFVGCADDAFARFTCNAEATRSNAPFAQPCSLRSLLFDSDLARAWRPLGRRLGTSQKLAGGLFASPTHFASVGVLKTSVTFTRASR